MKEEIIEHVALEINENMGTYRYTPPLKKELKREL